MNFRAVIHGHFSLSTNICAGSALSYQQQQQQSSSSHCQLFPGLVAFSKLPEHQVQRSGHTGHLKKSLIKRTFLVGCVITILTVFPYHSSCGLLSVARFLFLFFWCFLSPDPLDESRILHPHDSTLMLHEEHFQEHTHASI